MSDRSFLTVSLVAEAWEAGRAQGWTILCELETGLEGATATGRTLGAGGTARTAGATLFSESRASAVVLVLGDTGPFSWFSSQLPLKLRDIDFFQCLAVRGVSSLSVFISLTTRDSGSLCSGYGGDTDAKLEMEAVLPGETVDTSSESRKE